MTIETMKLALEAIENPWKSGPEGVAGAITALRIAIEQSEKQGQHWCTYCRGHNAHNCQFNTTIPRVHTYVTNTTAPASRQWVGLTDEERRNIREWQEIQGELGPVWAPMMLYLYLAIEAKLKQKNT